jgi:hypothetical protein
VTPRRGSWTNADKAPDDDGPLFRRPFDRGMDGSALAAGKWTHLQSAKVGDAIAACAATGEPFTADDVWARIPDVPVTKGLAARLNGAARRGLIRNMGSTVTAARGGAHDHGQRLTVWIGVR